MDSAVFLFFFPLFCFFAFFSYNSTHMSTEPIKKTEDEWKATLSEKEYNILRQKGTEQAFSGEYVDTHQKGIYTCKACGTELFDSDAKFDSGTGWPSFDEPKNLQQIELHEDTEFGMHRTEVRCKTCGSHLGHVFTDGPTKTGQRYCINSTCLVLKEKP